MNRRPRVAVIVLNFLHNDDTVRCLAAVQAGTYDDFVVVVVDNSPDPGVTEDLRNRLDPCVDILRPGENIGYAAGNNVGIKHAIERYDAQLFWVLNPDTVPAPDALEWLVRAADEHPDSGAIGSRLVDGAAKPRIVYNGASIDPVTGATSHRDIGRPVASMPASGAFDTDYVNGASLLLMRRRFPIAGLLPEDYFLYFEETDFALRLRQLGLPLLVEPRSQVAHLRRSWGKLPSSVYIYYMVRNREIFNSRWGFVPAHSDGSAPDAFIDGWRERIGNHRPALLPVYEDLVGAALADGRAGRTGPSPVPSQLELI